MIINRLDAGRLYKILAESTDDSILDIVEMLEEKLDDSNMVMPEDIPGDCVTMNCKIRLTYMDSGKQLVRTLVYPHALSKIQDGLSVLAPTGAAVLGQKKNDLIEVLLTNDSKIKLRIDEILWQPENMKQYYK